MQQPLVSIIVPNYNHARFLRQRIESILQQEYTNYELILLDDASTDESREIMESYRNNPHVSHICYNTVNTGSPFAQWKKGIDLAQGKYIWIAESDDYAESTFLSTTVSLMETNEEAAICFTGSIRVDETGKQLSKDNDRWRRRCYAQGYKIFEGEQYILHNLYWYSYIYNASGTLFRTQVARQVDMTPCCSMRCSGDWMFWTEMAYRGSVIEVYRKLNRFRFHSSSASQQAKRIGKSLEEDMKVIKQIENSNLHIGLYRRILRRGIFYKKIKRLQVDNNYKTTLFAQLKQSFDGSRREYFLERLNKYLSFAVPVLLTAERDRL